SAGRYAAQSPARCVAARSPCRCRPYPDPQYRPSQASLLIPSLCHDSTLYHAILPEHAANAAQRLTGAMFVFDQCEAHMVIAVVTKTDAGRDGHLRIVEQLLAEFQRAQRPVGLGN